MIAITDQEFTGELLHPGAPALFFYAPVILPWGKQANTAHRDIKCFFLLNYEEMNPGKKHLPWSAKDALF
ncbi:MAG: hypothetical protein R6U64_03620 [Bacteroidales bacterium]